MLFKGNKLVLELPVEGFDLVYVVCLNLAHKVFLWNMKALLSSQLYSY